jgi:ribonuclease-3 family protein
MENQNMLSMNTTVLAYIGDAVYEVYVREHVLLTGDARADNLHKSAVRYVRAEAQATALKSLMEDLTEEEIALVKRARNKKITSKPKNADPMAYKMATAFEALIGGLYLRGEKERITLLVGKVILLIDNLKHSGGNNEEKPL